MKALAIIVLILLLIAFLRLGINVIYSDGGVILKIKIGLFKISLYPAKKKKKERPEKKKKEKVKNKKIEIDEVKRGGPFDTVKQYLPPIIDTLKRLKRKISIDKLTVYFTAGAKDPFDAAMTFGRISALEGIIMPLLDNTFKIKNRDVRSGVSFDGDGNKIYLNAQITLAFWEIIYIGCGLMPLVTGGIKESRDGKAEKNGQASDK